MSDENQEVLEDADVQEEVVTDTEINEADAVGGAVKSRPGDKKQGDKAPQTKMGMLNAMMKNYGEIQTESLFELKNMNLNLKSLDTSIKNQRDD